jgi:UDP-glucose 4-epimerase
MPELLSGRIMKILVTGAAGFIGSHLTDELLASGHTVVGLDNLRNGNLKNIADATANDQFRFIQGDILNAADCTAACTGCDVVFHLACLGVRHSLHSPFENHRVNAEGSLRVLEAARQENVKRFFYISTSEIYGKTKSFPINESALTLPTTVYGASKLAGENYTMAYRECFGLNATVLRIFNNYGPRAHYEGDAGEVIPRTIVRIMNGKNPVVFGDGQVTRDFFFVKDTARVLRRLLEIDTLNGKTLNVGTGVEITVKHLIETLIQLMPGHNVQIDFHEDRPADVPRLWVNNSQLQNVMPLNGLMEFERGLRETISFYQQLSESTDLLSEVTVQNWRNEEVQS